jgi:glycosyltransferase involved in cell wall biosynthesis
MVHSGVVPSQFQNERDRSWFEAEFGIPEGAHVIGMMAQLIERKGHRYLFAAAPRILASHPDVRFLLLGTGPIRKKLDQLVRLLDLSDKVIFAGFRDDIERILPNLDMVVHPALREGLGVSLVQSACAGLPIVASAAGGIPEIVRDGETGLLVQPGDSLVLADAVIRLLNDPKRACQLGENARRLAEAEFSVDSMVEGNLRVYMDTLAQSFPR